MVMTRCKSAAISSSGALPLKTDSYRYFSTLASDSASMHRCRTRTQIFVVAADLTVTPLSGFSQPRTLLLAQFGLRLGLACGGARH